MGEVVTQAIMSGHQPHWLPGIEYFAKIAASSVFVVSDDVKFVRHDWMNRNRIRTAEGWTWVTATVSGPEDEPLWKKKQGPQSITKVAKAIEFSYRGCPYWKEMSGVVDLLWRDRLIDACWDQVVWICSRLSLVTVIRRATELGIEGESSSEKIAKQVAATGCNVYLSGRVALKNYHDPAPYASRGIGVMTYLWTPPQYPQRWVNRAPFQPNLCILDAVANVGWERTSQMIREATQLIPASEYKT